MYTNRTIDCDDSDINALRRKHPDGLRFVVGDTHGECDTLIALMDKIGFDPGCDSVFFVGDYNAGGNVGALLTYMSEYYREEYDRPGFI